MWSYNYMERGERGSEVASSNAASYLARDPTAGTATCLDTSPLFDEPHHPRLQRYEHEHTKRWSATVDRADAFAVVTPEYDFATPAALVNALQYLVHEWAYKPLGIVSYGGTSGGLRGVQMTKQIVTSLRMMPIPEGVAIPFFSKYIDAATRVFDPGETQQHAVTRMLDELLRWTTALAALREPQPA